MRAMDVLLAFPGLLLALLIVTILGAGLGSVMVAIGVSFIPVFTRVIYGSTLAARELDYVLAARAVGAGPLRIMARQILPNVVSHVVVIASSAIGWAILTATTLNFLGFGVHLPTPEWGADLAAGRDWLGVAWWISTFPGLAMTVTILAANYLGDHVAAVLEPRGRLALTIGRIGAGDV
jgi:ABC-type dipeptide/oligopeptide/nickel transport system permease subunit